MTGDQMRKEGGYEYMHRPCSSPTIISKFCHYFPVLSPQFKIHGKLKLYSYILCRNKTHTVA